MIVLISAYNLMNTLQCVTSLLTASNEEKTQVAIRFDGTHTDYLKLLMWLDGKDIDVMPYSGNIGYTKSTNALLIHARFKYSDAKYVLMNDDVIVKDHWLDKLIEASEECDAVAFHGRGNFMLSFSCVLVPRDIVLDERYSPGYYEDDDWCLSQLIAGKKLKALHGSTYIIHEGASSFGNATELMMTNAQKFIDKWTAIYEQTKDEVIKEYFEKAFWDPTKNGLGYSIEQHYVERSRVELWENVRVLVAAAHYGTSDITYHVESYKNFIFAAADLIKTKHIELYRDYTQPLDLNRSKAAWVASQPENGFTHIYFYDTDMDVSLAHIEKLLSRKVDCVSGTAFMGAHKLKEEDGKIVPGMAFPCVAAIDGKYVTREQIHEAAKKDELIEVGSVGCGSLLITTSLLRDIGSPAFVTQWKLQGNIHDIVYEDSYFSQLVTKAKRKMYLDPTVRPDHFKLMRVNFRIKDMNNYPFTTPEV